MDNELDLQPIRVGGAILVDVVAITAKYEALAGATTPEEIKAAALAIGDDIVIEYYYMEDDSKKYLQTTNDNDLIKLKYWEGYLNVAGNGGIPYWTNSVNTIIPAETIITTSTNPGTGAVNTGWLNVVKGKDLYVEVTVINDGGVNNIVKTVAIPALAGSYSYSWTTSLNSTDFDFTVGMGWSGLFPWPPNVYFFFHPDEIPLGYLEPIGGAWLFENIDFDITSAGQTFSVTSVADDPDFAGFANLLTNGTDEGIWFGYIGDCDNIASGGGQKDVQESLVFSGTDVGTDFPGLVIQSISLTFNQIYLDPDNADKLVLDFTIDIYAGLPNS